MGREAELLLAQTGAQPVEVELKFTTMTYVLPRSLRVLAGDTVVWSGPVGDRAESVQTRPFILPPGTTAVRFETPQPPMAYPPDEPRRLTFMMANLGVARPEP